MCEGARGGKSEAGNACSVLPPSSTPRGEGFVLFVLHVSEKLFEKKIHRMRATANMELFLLKGSTCDVLDVFNSYTGQARISKYLGVA